MKAVLISELCLPSVAPQFADSVCCLREVVCSVKTVEISDILRLMNQSLASLIKQIALFLVVAQLNMSL